METVNLLTLEKYWQERETILDIEVSSYNHEVQRVKHSLDLIENTKNTLVEEMNIILNQKLNEYESQYVDMYKGLIWMAKSTIYKKINKIKIDFKHRLLSQIIDVISTGNSLNEEYGNTLSALQELLKYLKDNCGVKGYRELNDIIGFLPKSSSNMELIRNAEKVIKKFNPYQSNTFLEYTLIFLPPARAPRHLKRELILGL